MIRKFVEVLKYLSIVIGVLIVVISCENDFRNVGVNIVDNNIFSADKHVSEVIAYSRNIERNQTNGLQHYLLGVQRDPIFGKLETSLLAQLTLAETNPDFGLDAVIDTVIVDIPYISTRDGDQEDEEGNTVPKFILDSIWTKGNKSFQLNVFELGTYLTNIDDDDPTKPKKYYSDDFFLKENLLSPLYSDIFTPNANDTMLVVKRYRHFESGGKEVYKRDTVKKTDISPSIKIPLDTDMITTIFQVQDNAGSDDFASNANFQHHFKGLYIEALENSSDNASLMTLDLSNAKMTIYFSYNVMETEEEGEDLDEDGISGETEPVEVRTPSSFNFNLSGIKTNLYDRDDSGSVVEDYINENADDILGEERLFVQGAAGSDAVIKLFGEDNNSNEIPDELETLRESNWLINDAQLIFYIDSDNTTSWAPERLYLYIHGKDENGEEENTQILDAMPQSLESIGGILERDADDDPEKYVFHVTDFISEILKSDSELVNYNFGIKVFDPNDVPTHINDTIISEFESNPKGLVLKGNKLSSSDDTRIKLDIYYSKKE